MPGRRELLRFVTAGSVDDGKSTLIGRLLYESQGLQEDQLLAVRRASGRPGNGDSSLDLSLVTDGLKAEREQGITIDVAYRYFRTPRRQFIIADTPGHEQYTRNMATGASRAELAVILVDARHGVRTQSRRHAFVASLLGIPHMVVAVNKMDLVDYREAVFEDLVSEFREFASRLAVRDLVFIPVSALKGDNVVRRGARMDWYGGRTLLDHLENVHIASDRNLVDARFPVQLVTRLGGDRGYLGTVASGVFRPGDEVVALPSGRRSRIRNILGGDGELGEAFPPLPVTLTLEDDIDVSRGDMLVHPANTPHLAREFDAMVVWMHEEPLREGSSYLLKHTTQVSPVDVAQVRYRVAVDTLRREAASELRLNEIGRCAVDALRPVGFDPYERNRTTGAFILIDRRDYATVGAGVILAREPSPVSVDPARRVDRATPASIRRRHSRIGAGERAARYGNRAATVWLTGLTGSGKTTLAYALERRLFEEGVVCQVLDGENLRLGLSRDLGFGPNDRAENVRRAAEVARILNLGGQIAICALLSPFREERERAAAIIGREEFLEIYLSAPVETCRARAGLYERADRGEIESFPGVSAPYEVPRSPALDLATHELPVEACVERILSLLRERGFLTA